MCDAAVLWVSVRLILVGWSDLRSNADCALRLSKQYGTGNLQSTCCVVLQQEWVLNCREDRERKTLNHHEEHACTETIHEGHDILLEPQRERETLHLFQPPRADQMPDPLQGQD